MSTSVAFTPTPSFSFIKPLASSRNKALPPFTVSFGILIVAPSGNSSTDLYLLEYRAIGSIWTLPETMSSPSSHGYLNKVHAGRNLHPIHHYQGIGLGYIIGNITISTSTPSFSNRQLPIQLALHGSVKLLF